tara:strand:- start:12 stop:584 length:573 start_codon:yes stop_codon:yes gene_type:complete
MFSEFGAPIIEGFDDGSCDYEPADDRCIVDNNTGKIKCKPEDCDTSDEEEEQAANEEEEEEEKTQSNNNNETETTSQSNNEEDKDEEDTESESESEDEDEEEPSSTPQVTDNFYGGKIEHFSNQEVVEKATSMNTVLKAVMITCLFYVLAHKDAKKYIMGNIFKSVKGENYLYIAMVIFFIIFYIISVFL